MTRRRRTRWLCELSRNGKTTERQILAYNADSVRDHYTRLGYDVHSVKAHRPSRTAVKATNPPWRKNERAIREAIELFGLTLPVEIKLTSHAGGRYGAHTLHPVGGQVRVHNGRIYWAETATGLVHRITVKAWRSAEEASRTLWHELTHAMQAERELSKLANSSIKDKLEGWRTCADRGHGLSYSRKPLEIEAREHESFHDDLPLTQELR